MSPPLWCYCEDESGCLANKTCLTKPNAACFHYVEKKLNEELGIVDEYHRFGCLPQQGGSVFQCKGDLTPHLTPKTIICCSSYDYCNFNGTPIFRHLPTDQTPSENGTFGSLSSIMAVICGVVVMLVLATITVLCIKKRMLEKKKRDFKGWGCEDGLLQGKAQDSLDAFAFYNEPLTIQSIMEQSSGSGSGLPQLVQRTIARQLAYGHEVGKGRFGEVYVAQWRGETVAVKTFQTTDEASWKREKEIYQTMMFRHEYLLGYIAADIRGTGGSTQMLLITDYHENGSLYDYLKSNELNYSQVCLLAYTAAAGLSHLHVEIFATEGKPAIAHRDIKSKNILIKRGGVCVIADFGLAVRYMSDKRELDIVPNPRQGTIRYMAPEVLNKTINERDFEAYKQADMYAFGLVLWEIASRCTRRGNSEPMQYRVPYENLVPPDPSFETMRNVVCRTSERDGYRPPIPQYWITDKILNEVWQCISECWHDDPKTRLTSLNVKKKLFTLQALADDYMKQPPLPDEV